jgi:cell division protein FtsQ
MRSAVVRRERVHWRRLGVVTMAIPVLGAAGWLVGFSSVLATEHVAVTGAAITSTDAVRTAAQVPIGLPLVRQDGEAIAARVAALRPVEKVKVSRKLPHTVVIAVTERTPRLAVRRPNTVILVDSTGVPFENVSKVPQGVVVAQINPDATPLLVEAGRVAGALPDTFARRVAHIEAGSPYSIRLVLRSGTVVTWGTAADSPLKAQIAERLLKRKPRAIDVSAPNAPAVR